nr:immunoglobulin heavy chain junction region [Mus musculus]
CARWVTKGAMDYW